MGNELYIKLNEISKEVFSKDTVLAWFDELDEQKRFDALVAMTVMIQQAEPIEADRETALESCEIKKTKTSFVVLSKYPLKLALAKFRNLPYEDMRDALWLMVCLYRVADGRRRATKCKNGCSHWWHQDK